MAAFAASALGVAVFDLAALPLPFLLGPMFACLGFALAGGRLAAPRAVPTWMRTVIGVAAGASITPAIAERAGDYALSLVLVPLFVLLAALIGAPYFRRLFGFDRPTAFFAAMPGGLQDMVAIGEDSGGDVRALALAHATRVFALVSAAPFIIAFVWDAPLTSAPGLSAAEKSGTDIALLLLCAIGGWKLAERLGVVGATVIGPMVAAAAFSLAGLLHARPPAEAILAAQFFIGLAVGVRYVGVTRAEIGRVVVGALGYVVILCALTALFSGAVVWAGAADSLNAALAFAPGGQGEMIVLAILAGADVAYIATIHVARVVVVILGAAVATKLRAGRADRRAGDRPRR